MRPTWKGPIVFGLVNIPVQLYPAVRKEEIRLRQLRASDSSPINYKRVAEADGKEVPYEKIAKGYEFEKGRFVILTEDDLDAADPAATKSVTIETFVDAGEVSSLHFYKPYFMEPQKGADHAYVLLRDALMATGKIGIARVVLSSKQHLAAVRPHEGGLILELMHFAEDMVSANEFKLPSLTAGKKELEMAKSLIGSMAEKWKPETFRDDYSAKVMAIVEQKVKSGGKGKASRAPGKSPGNVVDLMAALQESLKGSGMKRKPVPATVKGRTQRKAG